jgi:hypothetical protein
MRTERRDIMAISLMTKWITLGKDQYFCETPKAYELWGPVNGGLPLRIMRWPKVRIYWVSVN